MARFRMAARRAVLIVMVIAGHSLGAQPSKPLITGVNYPWIAYGHDFGKNEWGHDGLITGGWTYQTYADSQGFSDSRFSTSKAHTGVGSLSLTADLIGGHPNQSKGEVYIDLRNHTPAGASVPINLTTARVSCWLFLPRGSAGDPSAPNGVQFFFKSGKAFDSLYTSYQNFQSDQEETWVQFTADASESPAHVDPRYNPTDVIAVGLKISINGSSSAALAGTIFLDDYALSTAPPIAFGFEKLEVEDDFAALQQTLGQCSLPAVRVFVFADGRAAPEFAFDDQITGLDESFFPDFDALLDAAKRHRLMVIPVVLDFGWFNRATFENDVQLGGRSNVARNSERRQAFLDKALKPLVDRYCNHSQILAWDVINEPEWATKELPDPAGFHTTDQVSLAEMQELVRLAAQTIRPCGKVTVGSARRKWLQYWLGSGLDLYQFHWYEHFSSEEPFPWQPYSQLALDKPAIVGEVPTANSHASTRDYLLGAANGGYDGLLVWSYRLRDDASEFANARSMLEGWCSGFPRRRSVGTGVPPH